MITHLEDNELFLRIRQGNEDAFEYIFKKYFSGLCLYAEHFTKDPAASKDIVEDFFVELWDNCRSISINTYLKGYLYRSVHNRCLKYIRHQNIEREYASEQQYYYFDEEILGTNKDGYQLNHLIAEELEEKIAAAVQSLPGQCRQIFCKNRYENKSYPEISEQLGISVNTVKTQMSRALQKLREELKDFLS